MASIVAAGNADADLGDVGAGPHRPALLAVALVLIALLSTAGVLAFRSGGTTASSVLEKLVRPLAGNSNGNGTPTGLIASVGDALGLIAERSPGAREGAQLVNKPARLAALDSRRLATLGRGRSPTGRDRTRSRLIPGRGAAPAAIPGSSPDDLQITDILPELGAPLASTEDSLAPVGLTLPSSGGGSVLGPGPVFIGGSLPGPSGVVTPPVVEPSAPASAVPEPATWLLFMFGLAAVAHAMRRGSPAHKQRLRKQRLLGGTPKTV